MVTITRWTGRHARILREVALRMSIHEFAEHTNLSTSAIRDWENKGEQARLRLATQRILDQALNTAPDHAQQRFTTALADTTEDIETTGTTDQASAAVMPMLGADQPLSGIGHEVVGATGVPRDFGPHFQDEGGSWTQRLTTGLAAEVRTVVEREFDDGLSYADRLARLQESTHMYATRVAVTAPHEMISCLAPDLGATCHLLRYAQTRADAMLLRSVLARLSAMIADELSVLGNIEPARDWYITAIAAADRSDSQQLQATIRALAAMLPLYHGRQSEVVQIAQQARHLAGTTACVATSLAPMFEALARARLGDHDRARQALHDAQTAHDRMDSSEKAESFFGLSVRRRLFYEGRLLTMVGDYAAAEAAHRQARVLYPPQVVGDPAIMDIDRATALINSNDPEAGASVIVSTLSGLPADQQGGIFLALAGRAFDAIPTRARRLPAPRTCAELLDTLSASQ